MIIGKLLDWDPFCRWEEGGGLKANFKISLFCSICLFKKSCLKNRRWERVKVRIF